MEVNYLCFIQANRIYSKQLHRKKKTIFENLLWISKISRGYTQEDVPPPNSGKYIWVKYQITLNN